MLVLDKMITELTQLGREWEPLYWFVFFVTALMIYIEGGSKFWTFTLYAAMGMLGVSLVYIFGSIPQANFLKVGPKTFKGKVPFCRSFRESAFHVGLKA
jgi:hypothetical protein